MMIEDKFFMRKRFDPKGLEAYGFIKREKEYILSTDFMDGDFRAEIVVTADGKVRGKVIDRMNDEEYLQLRIPAFNGAYVNTVRSAYEEILGVIAEKCCTEVCFAADQSNRIAATILEKYGVAPDFPWDNDRFRPCGVFRHGDNNKWFGLIMNIGMRLLVSDADNTPVDVINLKINPEEAGTLHKCTGIFPAYHMNHRTWISVILDDDLPDEQVMELVDSSYRLTSSASGRGMTDDEFIRKVLEIADSVPYGKVAAYGQIAKLAGRGKNARLVGKIMSMADRYGEHPCHRVVSSSGRTVPGWTEQRPMLESEGIRFRENGCVDMNEFRWEP